MTSRRKNVEINKGGEQHVCVCVSALLGVVTQWEYKKKVHAAPTHKRKGPALCYVWFKDEYFFYFIFYLMNFFYIFCCIAGPPRWLTLLSHYHTFVGARAKERGRMPLWCLL